MKPDRKVIQILMDKQNKLVVLCDDGTMWVTDGTADGWKQIKPIPRENVYEN